MKITDTFDAIKRAFPDAEVSILAERVETNMQQYHFHQKIVPVVKAALEKRQGFLRYAGG